MIRENGALMAGIVAAACYCCFEHHKDLAKLAAWTRPVLTFSNVEMKGREVRVLSAFEQRDRPSEPNVCSQGHQGDSYRRSADKERSRPIRTEKRIESTL